MDRTGKSPSLFFVLWADKKKWQRAVFLTNGSFRSILYFSRGWLSWGSAIGGMLFNLIFGVVMDAARPVVDGGTKACKGHGCFRWALVVSFSACAMSCALSVVMVQRQKRAALASRR